MGDLTYPLYLFHSLIVLDYIAPHATPLRHALSTITIDPFDQFLMGATLLNIVFLIAAAGIFFFIERPVKALACFAMRTVREPRSPRPSDTSRP